MRGAWKRQRSTTSAPFGDAGLGRKRGGLAMLALLPFTYIMETRGIGQAQGAAVGGLARAAKVMEQAAAEIANVAMKRQASEATGSAATVTISPQARALVEGVSDPTGDIASAFVDQGIAKHLTAANVKVLQTTDETLKELTRIKR